MTDQSIAHDTFTARAASRRGGWLALALLLAFGLGYQAGGRGAPDFSDQHQRAASPAVEDWHGNVRRAGG